MKKRSVSLVVLMGLLFLSASATFLTPSVKQVDNSVDHLKTSAGEITIVTPENKTYTESDSGYYPATYGFENDADGNEPDGWVLFPEDPAMYTEILPELGGHKKIIDMNKGNTGGQNYNLYQYFAEPPEYGTIELWVRADDVSEGSDYVFHTDVWGFGIRDNAFHYFEPVVWNPIAFPASDNTWYHVKVQFECSSGNNYGLSEDSWRIFINGNQFGDFNFSIAQTNVTNLRISQNWRFSNYHTYTDAIGYSWDPSYNIGDNLNEGLLLSYENSTTLDWQGYSLDSQANRTILGNVTIPMPADGLHRVQVFGNDSINTMYESNTRYFTVNTAPPEIGINSPTDSQVIGSTAPSYDISITGPYDSIWYALEGGTNYTATGLTGTIDQSAWSALPDEIITIDFYANNSAGMKGTAQVMVVKDSSEEPPPTPPGIPGYNLIALVGACGIITLVIIKKKRGRIKP